MDNFTKGLLERNEKRNKALGISTKNVENSVAMPQSKISFDKNDKENRNSDAVCSLKSSSAKISEQTTYTTSRKVQSPKKSAAGAATEITRQTSRTVRNRASNSNDDKPADVNVEINIKSSQNIQVEVEVAECEIDENGQMIMMKGETVNSLSNFDSNKASLRDSSRKNLKRLGVLYSDNDQISSPIQRTEENFCEQSMTEAVQRPIKKFTKLAALASDINSWDDDYSHHGITPLNTANTPTKTGTFTKKNVNQNASPKRDNVKMTLEKNNKKSSPSKKLMWDKKVMDSLEAQGFTRRESTVPKLVYDYGDKPGTSGSGDATSTTVSSLMKPKTIQKNSPKKNITPTSSTVTLNKGSPINQTTVSNSPVKNKVSAMISKVNGQSVVPGKTVTFSNGIAKNKDPAEMSLKDRMAIFEKNKGTAPMPKCAFGLAEANPIRNNMEELSKKFNFGFKAPAQKSEATKKSPAKTVPPPPAPPIPTFNVPEKVPENAARNVKTAVTRLLLEKETTISERQISENVRKQREEDMKCILNRFNKPVEDEDVKSELAEDIDDIDHNHSSSENNQVKRRSSEEKYGERRSSRDGECYQKNTEDKKRVRVSRPDRLYPVLSDLESTTTILTTEDEDDSEMDAGDENYTTATVSASESDRRNDDEYEEEAEYSDDEDDDNDSEERALNMSLGREIMASVTRNHQPMDTTGGSGATSTDASQILDEMDDYLDEALGDGNDPGSACSDSFEYARQPKRVSFQQDQRRSSGKQHTPIKSRLEIVPCDKSDSVTLTHTVSFYRRQQNIANNSAHNTPIKKMTNQMCSTSSSVNYQNENERRKNDAMEVDERIKKLLEEVCKQQTVIAQSSQALNLCASLREFSGSSEAVEGERHLLVATHRRQACMAEMQRLKVEGLNAAGIVEGSERGTITVHDVLIPLKQSYLDRLAKEEINGHHFVCLLKYNEHVLATKTVPSLPGLRCIKFPDELIIHDVDSNFKMTLEIYGMLAHRETLPHEIKYHISTPNKKSKTSSRKLIESSLIRPPIQSPGGPNVVRSPALIKYGFIVFSLREIKQKSWVINETAASVSPLSGQIFLRIDSRITVDVEHSGFLTMFDDISGFGAWHRRWCRLNGNALHYWKYPEDERHKSPLGQLNLTSIISERVDVAPRTVCARLNTILLESKRERRNSDVATLVLVPKENYTLVRHLLAADTKEDRIEWCLHLNKALTLMKSWGGHRC